MKSGVSFTYTAWLGRSASPPSVYCWSFIVPRHLIFTTWLQALNTIPRERAEWFIWLDMDMVLENVTFDLPLDSYEGRDIIMWGQPEWIARGHNAKGGQAGPCWSALTSQQMVDSLWGCSGGARVSPGGPTLPVCPTRTLVSSSGAAGNCGEPRSCRCGASA